MDLRELNTLGGFFALRTGTEGTPPGTPLARVYEGELTELTRRVDLVTERHNPSERRVAASIAQLGIAARLWSIALGAAALYRELPDLDPRALWWTADRSTPDDLVLTTVRSRPGTAANIRETVQENHLRPLSAALRTDTRISARLLWGNAGSALAAAVQQIDGWAFDHDRPEVARRAEALAAELFDHPDLRGTVEGPRRRRTSCCLYYRAPRGSLCGDCVFSGRPAPAAP
ncbi:IucA/IucC family C-terminal-domain containing protein [Streptomyces sp. NPDC057638]|uniref:IucA/IucC family C-terminal-domain containing protein n=1 Tax=Streptomyces sp. NPDC057638 TaxID=3346190 RepID=UPI0036BE7059